MNNSKTQYERLLIALEAAEVAWWEMKLPSGDINFSKTKTDLLGYKSSNFKKYTDFTELVYESDFGPMMQAMSDHISGKRPVYEALFRIKASDGSYNTYYDRGKIVYRDKDEMIITGITINMETMNGYLFSVMSKPYEPIKNVAELGL